MSEIEELRSQTARIWPMFRFGVEVICRYHIGESKSFVEYVEPAGQLKMSHPFTPEYMLEGETTSHQIVQDINKPKGNEKASIVHTSVIASRQCTTISESVSKTGGWQADQVEDNPEGDMEVINEELNTTIPENERMSFSKILNMAFKRRMGIFAEDVSIVGLSYLFKPSNYKIGLITRKAIWTLLLLFGIGFMIFQIYDRITFYLTYPTIVDYRVAYNRSLRFPAVTLCSEAIMSKRALTSLGKSILNHLH